MCLFSHIIQFTSTSHGEITVFPCHTGEIARVLVCDEFAKSPRTITKWYSYDICSLVYLFIINTCTALTFVVFGFFKSYNVVYSVYLSVKFTLSSCGKITSFMVDLWQDHQFHG